jgi:K+-sensing histidine kinase KdpD
MIKLTGAQYAWLFLEGSKQYEKKQVCIDYRGNIKNIIDIPYSKNILNIVKQNKKVILFDDVSKEFENDKDKTDTARITIIKSVLCAPLMRNDNYLGCVYLGNNMVSGLFSDESKKSVEILAAQAGVLIENAYLMDEYKRLNSTLGQKVDEQLKDIKDKNNQLSEVNLRLMEVEQMRKLLTDTVVHDIKNYATGIEGNINILSRRFADNQQLKRPFSLISSTCTDITNLTSNLLDISKIEESKLEVRKQAITFAQIGDIIEQFKTNFMFEERNISFSLVPSADNFTIEADYYLLTRVLQNLFSNAAKYTSKNGQIAISTYSEGSEDIICFFSSGTPIPEKTRLIIFEKYSRAEGGGNVYSKGLGLFFCKMVTTAHQGRIWLDTDERGNYFNLAFKRTLNRQKAPLVS